MRYPRRRSCFRKNEIRPRRMVVAGRIVPHHLATYYGPRKWEKGLHRASRSDFRERPLCACESCSNLSLKLSNTDPFKLMMRLLLFSQNDESSEGCPLCQDLSPAKSRLASATFVIPTLVLAAISFLAGCYYTQLEQRNQGGNTVQPTSLSDPRHFSGLLPTPFRYNRTFSSAPSPETDISWDSIFPPHGGFFNNTEAGMKRGTFAVFHQLHCLVSSSCPGEISFCTDLGS